MEGEAHSIVFDHESNFVLIYCVHAVMVSSCVQLFSFAQLGSRSIPEPSFATPPSKTTEYKNLRFGITMLSMAPMV